MADKPETRNLWEVGRVFFNHFVRLKTNPDEETLTKAYFRGSGILPPIGYKGCDLIIPVFVPNGKVSYFLFQVKSRARDTMSAHLRSEARTSLHDAAKNLPKTMAHIGMMMSLRGREGCENMATVYPSEASHPATKQSSARQRETPSPKYNWGDMNRVVLLSVGFGLKMFRGVGLADESVAENEKGEALRFLQSLLDCNSETPIRENNEYFKHLAPRG